MYLQYCVAPMSNVPMPGVRFASRRDDLVPSEGLSAWDVADTGRCSMDLLPVHPWLCVVTVVLKSV